MSSVHAHARGHCRDFGHHNFRDGEGGGIEVWGGGTGRETDQDKGGVPMNHCECFAQNQNIDPLGLEQINREKI